MAILKQILEKRWAYFVAIGQRTPNRLNCDASRGACLTQCGTTLH